MKEKKVALIVGYHFYDVRPFQEMFESFPGIHSYIQHLEQFTSSSREVRDSYDALVFYTMEHRTPEDGRPWYEGNVKEAMEHLGECGQGLVIMHHSLLAFEKWPVWKDLCGLDPDLYHDYRLDVPQKYTIDVPDHPITEGMEEFGMVDEAYLCDRVEPVDGMQILVSSKDSINMNAVAWTKTFRNSKVFCFQAGHGPTSFSHESFRKLLYRGLLWTMGEV